MRWISKSNFRKRARWNHQPLSLPIDLVEADYFIDFTTEHAVVDLIAEVPAMNAPSFPPQPATIPSTGHALAAATHVLHFEHLSFCESQISVRLV